MHFTYSFPLSLYTSVYVQSLYLHKGSKVTEPEALETKLKEKDIRT